ncbi:MAG: nuclear transport factor 2 family protein [Acidimicrobiales bacterium]
MNAEDFVELQQLLSRYCHIVDTTAWDQLDQIFTDDASVTVAGVYPKTTGIEELRALYARMNHPVAHTSSSLFVVESSDRTARLASKWVTVRAEGLAGTGVYEDVVVRTPAGWRISERVAQPAVAPRPVQA